MLTPSHRPAVAVLALLLAGVAGCGGSRLYPVEGVVVFPGDQPARELAGGSVEFEAIDGKGSARGNIRPDGTFQMETQRPGDGVTPGRYQVVVIPPPPASVDRPPPPVLDPRFQRFATSGLVVEVKPAKNVLTLPVDRPAATKPGGAKTKP